MSGRAIRTGQHEARMLSLPLPLAPPSSRHHIPPWKETWQSCRNWSHFSSYEPAMVLVCHPTVQPYKYTVQVCFAMEGECCFIRPFSILKVFMKTPCSTPRCCTSDVWYICIPGCEERELEFKVIFFFESLDQKKPWVPDQCRSHLEFLLRLLHNVALNFAWANSSSVCFPVWCFRAPSAPCMCSCS